MKSKNKIRPISDDFTAEDIKIESSICTGEKTIGFYSAADKKLHYGLFGLMTILRVFTGSTALKILDNFIYKVVTIRLKKYNVL